MKWISSLVLPARLDSLPTFISSATQAATAAGLKTERLFNIELALEEALVNIINYAYEQGEGDVRLTCGVDGRNWFVMEVEDAGRGFDIRSVPPPDVTKGVEERRVGGLGIHFIRSLMDEVAYRREERRNILELRLAP